MTLGIAESWNSGSPGLALSSARLVPVTLLSSGYSPRQTKLDTRHVAALMDVVDHLPPVIVDERTMTVIDGMHRLEVFRRVGRSHIQALFFTGNQLEALVLAIAANVKHGKPLSREERRAAAGVLLRNSPDRSDRWVGEVCGLSHTTVAAMRKGLSIADVRTRKGRDGRMRPVDPKPGRAAVASVMQENPSITVRQAAVAAGVAPSTVQRVAGRHKPGTRPTTSRAQLTWPGASPSDAGPGPAPPPPESVSVTSWLARTAVTIDDLCVHLGNLPLSRMYEVADECRRRAGIWTEIGDTLELRARHSPLANTEA